MLNFEIYCSVFVWERERRRREVGRECGYASWGNLTLWENVIPFLSRHFVPSVLVPRCLFSFVLCTLCTVIILVFYFRPSTAFELFWWCLDFTSDLYLFYLRPFLSQFFHLLYWPRRTIKYDGLAAGAFLFFLSSNDGTTFVFLF